MDESLIYDVGMHNGDDTAHYLEKGFRVLAVEAAPDLAEAGRARFREEIAGGRLTILEVAIAAEDGDISFYQNDEKSVWNSTSAERAGRGGLMVREVRVRGVRFGGILDEHGVPWYLKVDIEGGEHLCVAGLDPADLPRYVSFELSPGERASIERLHELGYRDFKCMSQDLHLPMEVEPDAELAAALKEAERKQRFALLAHRARHRIESAPGSGPESPSTRPTALHGSSFPAGSSGPFGDETPGRWQSLPELLATLDHFEARFRAGQPSPFWSRAERWGIWADIHARRPGS